jgi:7-cyano-7-deazaguanine synthase
MSSLPNAIVLLSGGLDSATTLAIAQADGYRCWALNFRYGQRNQDEIQLAKEFALSRGVAGYRLMELDLAQFGGSALTDDLPVPKDRSFVEIEQGIPITYVPARNTIFLAYALAWSEVLPARHIFIGVHALDYSGYPDCRPEYIEAFARLANLATRAGVQGDAIEIHAPLLHLSKTQIIARGMPLGVDYSLTTSCYDPQPDRRACGTCDACLLRLRGFQENGVEDPVSYAIRPAK